MHIMNFSVYKPLQGHDEDSIPYANNKVLIVCDGLGGGGQNRYLINGETRTSAYLGSRQVSLATRKYFNQCYNNVFNSTGSFESMIDGLKKYISESLTTYVGENGLKNAVKGKSMQMLPSTLAAIVYSVNDSYIDALVISAGDSRAYLLTPENGLQQLSTDDVFEELDAYSKSATMTNNIRQDGHFSINYAYYRLPINSIIFVSSDGCFDYISTPMEWEYILEKAIVNCENVIGQSGNNLGDSIGSILEKRGLKDDCTIAGAIVGYSDSDELRKAFYERGTRIESNYIIPYNNIEKEAIPYRKKVADRICETERKISLINEQIESEIKKAILQVLQYKMSETTNISERYQYLLELLESFDLYSQLVTLVEQKSAHREQDIQRLTNEYSEKRVELKKAFEIAAKEKYQKELLSSSLLSRNINYTMKKQMNGYEDELKVLKQDYVLSVRSISSQFNALNSLIYPNSIPTETELIEIFTDFSYWVTCYNELSKTQRNMKDLIDRAVDDYLQSDEYERYFLKCWKNGFNDFNVGCNYSDLEKLYKECWELKKKIESLNPLSTSERYQIALEFFYLNAVSFIKFITETNTALNILCYDQLEKKKRLEESVDEYKSNIQLFDEKKKQLWLIYKPIYELFKTCKQKGSV